MNRSFSHAAAALTALGVGSVLAIAGCNSTSQAPPTVPSLAGTFAGPAKTLGNGTVSAYVTDDVNGMPTSVGFRISSAALTNLPANDTEVPLALPAEAVPSAFKSLVLNWNPHGHEPPGIYDLPHFDFHFYMIDEATRAAVSPTAPSALQSPPPDQIPPGYASPAAAVVPAMGVHWLDMSSPELNGQKFTSTLIYGYYSGSMTFIEPMITLAYLQSKPALTASMRTPKTYPSSGKRYPTGYSATYDAGSDSYLVELTGLTQR